MTHIALFDFIPNFCPSCGKKFDWTAPYARDDYKYRCSHSCDCGIKHQLAYHDKMVNAAIESEGDLAYHLKRESVK